MKKFFLFVSMIFSCFYLTFVKAETKYECPINTIQCGSSECSCMDAKPDNSKLLCKSGWANIDGECYEKAIPKYQNIKTCPDGYKEYKDGCIANQKSNSSAASCETGYVLIGGNCYKKISKSKIFNKCLLSIKCTGNMSCECRSYVSTLSAVKTCKNGFTKVGNECYAHKGYIITTKTLCENDEILYEDGCRKKEADSDAKQCPDGYIIKDNNCYKVYPFNVVEENVEFNNDVKSDENIIDNTAEDYKLNNHKYGLVVGDSYQLLVMYGNGNYIKKIDNNNQKYNIKKINIEQENINISWKSSDENVVVVDEEGKITAISQGKATITASISGQQLNCDVLVIEPIEKKEVNYTEKIEFIEPKISMGTDDIKNINIEDSQQIIYKSSDESIAEIDSNGNISAKKAGEVTINAISSDGKISASSKIVIESPSIDSSEIPVSKIEDFDVSYKCKPIEETSGTVINNICSGKYVLSINKGNADNVYVIIDGKRIDLNNREEYELLDNFFEKEIVVEAIKQSEVKSKTITLSIDNDKPTIPNSQLKVIDENGVILEKNVVSNEDIWWGNFEANDETSGIDYFEISEDCNEENIQRVDNYFVHSIDKNNAYNKTYCLRSVDKAGNKSDWSQKYVFKIDKKNPTVDVIRKDKGYVKSANIKIKLSDRDSGLDLKKEDLKMYLSNSSTSLKGGQWINYTNDTTITIGKNLTGEYYLFIKDIKDKSGNSLEYGDRIISGVKYHLIGTFKFDNTPPTVPNVSLYRWNNNSDPNPTTNNKLNLYTVNDISDKNIFVLPQSTDNRNGEIYYIFSTAGATENINDRKQNYRNILANGISTIKYKACDSLNNCSKYSEEYKIVIVKNKTIVNSLNNRSFKISTVDKDRKLVGNVSGKQTVMQNFGITFDNNNKINYIYYSYPSYATILKNEKFDSKKYIHLYQTHIMQTKPNKKDTKIIYLNNAGHGSNFDILSNNGENIVALTNTDSFIKTNSAGSINGGSISILESTFKFKNVKSNSKSSWTDANNDKNLNVIKTRFGCTKNSVVDYDRCYNKNNNFYEAENGTTIYNLYSSYDKKNNLIGVMKGFTLYIYNYEDFVNNSIYRSASNNKTYVRNYNDLKYFEKYFKCNDIFDKWGATQNFILHDGYLYMLNGTNKNNYNAITAINILSGNKKTISFSVEDINNAINKNKDLSKAEPEGIKIYNDKIYIGVYYKYKGDNNKYSAILSLG